ISSGSGLSPGITCPPLRPDAPWPMSCASSTTTFRPASASTMAQQRPVYPAPTMATSASALPSSETGTGAGVAVARQSEWLCSSFAWTIALMPLLSTGLREAREQPVVYVAEAAVAHHQHHVARPRGEHDRVGQHGEIINGLRPRAQRREARRGIPAETLRIAEDEVGTRTA